MGSLRTLHTSRRDDDFLASLESQLSRDDIEHIELNIEENGFFQFVYKDTAMNPSLLCNYGLRNNYRVSVWTTWYYDSPLSLTKIRAVAVELNV
jgi:hypothetical protein